jgi:hypothetical protein
MAKAAANNENVWRIISMKLKMKRNISENRMASWHINERREILGVARLCGCQHLAVLVSLTFK